MISENDLILLLNLENRIVNQHDEDKNVDIRPLAEEIGLNIDEVMCRVMEICQTKKYNVGSHMGCTRDNVIPEYKRSGNLKLDRDHVEGLRRILAVDMGITPDY